MRSAGAAWRAAPWSVSAMVLASTSMALGLLWDLSWHRSIGRDAFWSPPHVPIYLGALAAGLTSAWLIARATFGPGGAWAPAVAPIGPLRGPTGAWLGLWGALAMLTAAPFDDWWHGAYGLDVEILSPPHVLLVLGIVAMQAGALLLVAAWRNGNAQERTHPLVPAFAASIVLLMIVFLLLESVFPTQMHRAAFYEISAVAFPWMLVALARAERAPWRATTAAGLYFLVSALMMWILPLFPATPRLVPVHHPVTAMVPHPFPLLLPLPALAIDALIRRWKRGDWLLAAALGVAFVALFAPAQWWFADFLLSPAARNWLFAGDAWSFYTPGDRRFEFWGTTIDPVNAVALARACVLAAASARAGLWLGDWMRSVQR